MDTDCKGTVYLKKLEEELSAMEQKKENMKKEYEQTCETLDVEYKKLKTENASLEALLNNVRSELWAMEQNKEKMKKEYEQNCANLDVQCEKLKTENGTLEASLNNAHSELSGMEQNKEKMKKEYEQNCENLDVECDKLKTENATLEAKLNDVHLALSSVEQNKEMMKKEYEQKKANEVGNPEYLLRCLDVLLQDIFAYAHSSDESVHMRMRLPAETSPELFIAERYQHAREICTRFTKIESDIKELKDKSLGQKIILDVLYDYITAKIKSDPYVLPHEVQCDQSFNKEIEQAECIVREFKKMASDIKELKGCQGILLKQLDEYVKSTEQNAMFVIPSDLQTDRRFLKEIKWAKHVAEKFEKMTRDLERLKAKSYCQEVLLTTLDDYVRSKKQNATYVIPSNLKSDVRFVKEIKMAEQLAEKFEKMTSVRKELEAKSNCQQILLENLENYVTCQKQNARFSIPRDVYNDQRFVNENNQAIRIAQGFGNGIRCISELERNKNNLYSLVEKQKEDLAVLKEEKETALTRLSKLIGDRLTHDNANIADLSDADRPTKLSECFSELYDNEWTDAFEELTENTGLSDEEANKRLLDIIMMAFRKCKEITWDRYELLKENACKLYLKEENVPSTDVQESGANTQIEGQGGNNEENAQETDGENKESDANMQIEGQAVNNEDNGPRTVEGNKESCANKQNEGQGGNNEENGPGNDGENKESGANKQNEGQGGNNEENGPGTDGENKESGANKQNEGQGENNEENGPGTDRENKESGANKQNEGQGGKNEENGPGTDGENKESGANKQNEGQGGNNEENGPGTDGEKKESGANKQNEGQGGKNEENGPGTDGENKESGANTQHKGQGVNNEAKGTGTDGENKKNVETKTTILNFTLSIDETTSLKKIWRSSTTSLRNESLTLIYEMLSTRLRTPETNLPKTYKYLTVCCDVCWKMFMQEKPMYLEINAEKQIGQEKLFDTERFRAYTKAGKYVAYVVWPALFLHEGGPMLAKGIAQGCNKVPNT